MNIPTVLTALRGGRRQKSAPTSATITLTPEQTKAVIEAIESGRDITLTISK